MDIMVEGPRSGQVAGMLHEREIPYSVAVGDVAVLFEREQGHSASKIIRRGSATLRKRRFITYCWFS